MNRIKILIVVSLLMLGVIGFATDKRWIPVVGSYSTGPPPGFTGAPGEPTCIECHTGGSGPGTFTIIAPPTYVPGQTYQIIVRHVNMQTSRKRWGFQLTSVAQGVRAGTLSNLSGQTQTIDEVGRQYIEHTLEGSFLNQTGGAQWTFNWTAPPEDIGTIDLWAAGNQANADGTSDGDQIYTANVSIEASAATPTPTNTPTATPTNTPTATPTATPTSTPTATPTVTPTPGFEGDVAPRPNGDGIVISTDVTQLRRFAAGLDVPDPLANEPQRVDCAPRSTFGDGLVNSGDVVQGRRYATGLDPLTGTAGPTGISAAEGSKSIFADIYEYFFGREIRAGSAKAERGTQVSVPVYLSGYGDEAAVGFTIEFDASRLSVSRVSLGEDLPSGTTLTLNTNEAGRIGVLVDSAEPFSAAGARWNMITITFDVAKDATEGETSVLFSDSLAQRSISDALGDTISARFTGGVVAIAGER